MKRWIRRFFAAFFATAMLISSAYAAPVFPDVDESAEYVAAVEYVSEIGIMVGDNSGRFNPHTTVTRAEMATIICRMLGETEALTTSTQFSDVPAKHWANPYVSKAAELGIVNGYGNGKFGPSDTVTYEQAVTMIVRTAGWGGEAEQLGGYPDGFISVASERRLLENIMAEKGEALSRSDIAIIIYNYYNI